MLLQLQRYDLNVTYTPRKELLNADTLSRAVLHERHMAADDVTDERVVYALEPTDALSTGALEQLKSETKKDKTLQLLHDTHRRGWPRHRKQLDSILANQTHSG